MYQWKNWIFLHTTAGKLFATSAWNDVSLFYTCS